MLFYIIAIVTIIIDQVTKIYIRTNVEMYERFTWLGMEFTYIENSGMAGGFFPGYARVFGVVAIFFVIFVFYIRKSDEWRGGFMDIGLGLLVGGAIGNGVDRMIFGEVTDFIVRSGGILNIADHALELGILILLVYLLIEWVRSKRSKSKDGPPIEENEYDIEEGK
ncbi:signal peptidase II [Oceanobacillus sp. CAU 1775]